MQCPNPECEEPGLGSILLLAGERIKFCPKCGSVLSLSHPGQSGIEELKTNEEFKTSSQEAMQDNTGEQPHGPIPVTQTPLPESSQTEEEDVTILGSACVFGPSLNKESLDKLSPKKATGDASKLKTGVRKRSNSMHQLNIDDSINTKRMKTKSEPSDVKFPLNDEERIFEKIESGGELEQTVFEEAQPEEKSWDALVLSDEFIEDQNREEIENKEGNATQILKVTPDEGMDEEYVTIEFQGLLSPSFNFIPEKHRVFLRAGHDKLGLSWDHNVAEMYPVSVTKEKFVVICGNVQLPIGFGLPIHLPYKYVVCTDTTVEWEYLELFDDSKEFVNRSMYLSEDRINKNDFRKIHPKKTSIFGEGIGQLPNRFRYRYIEI